MEEPDLSRLLPWGDAKFPPLYIYNILNLLFESFILVYILIMSIPYLLLLVPPNMSPSQLYLFFLFFFFFL